MSGPVVSRRREVSGGSARSLLTTVLGEFVLPLDRQVWTSALVEALALFDVEEKAARQALARTAAEGWLSADRVGRRVRWNLTADARRLLAEGATRIYGFGSKSREWDGRWLVVLVSVPETQRDLRHKLRTRLSWAGFGSPTAGVWITPHLSAEADAKLILDELDLSPQAMSYLAQYGALGSERTMVERAWDLAEVAARYQAFVDEFAVLAPSTPDEVLRAQTLLVHEWRRFPFLDPQLPEELLPPRWSGTTATALFNELHVRWRTPAQERWAELARD
ncbi:PaaX family transcriptional regulator C-terminal domain-containing protein [Actinophytocola sp.]|jgi:phenylacetic acid degradation operon negative regulatory protein|uniref:PaaX family transcriptional regulator n=1 Tax=Actinophytocola sp. TaxID=1872138 RepID=UPI002D538D87|nr:PaaX family transcriptional regulator C-terminal domain-containing protein [Actinophytocola sp.]HYQ64399.1 PaaX family transcriptional regulator C-terminal domain-containing protein [Actinophytocola sp.]